MTAVEWFFRWVNDNPEATYKEYAEAFEQAKEIEKQQIKDAWFDGYGGSAHSEDEYYNETYGSDSTLNSSLNSTLNSSSQTEISDEEINEKAEEFELTNGIYGFKQGVKWAIEQLKKK